MKLGYARVSTTDEDFSIQRDRLEAAGCEKLFEEKTSGARQKRPELERLLAELRANDVVVVTRLGRLARSTFELLRIAETIEAKHAGLQSIAEPWADTTTQAGRMVLTVFAGIAEFERSLIATRTAGVVVSMASWRDRNPTPRSWSEFTTSIRSRRERPRRSSFHTTTTSPLRANARSFSLAGRVVLAPESFSRKSFSQPPSVSASCWSRSVWSWVETRAYPMSIITPPCRSVAKVARPHRIATMTCATGFCNAIRVLILRREPAVHMKIRFPHSNGKAEQSVKAATDLF